MWSAAASIASQANGARDVALSPISRIVARILLRTCAGRYCAKTLWYTTRHTPSCAGAFMREISLKIAAEWREPDLAATAALVASGALSLDGLITHRVSALDAAGAYRTAFEDASCLKMILDWRDLT